MDKVVALDVYGTLINPFGITGRLEAVIGDDALRFALAWREKQMEYLFRRALGRNYVSFSVCTRQALEYCCRRFAVPLAENDKEVLLAAYLELPAYPGVSSALLALRNTGCRSFAFSNGEPADLDTLLQHGGLLAVLDGVVSTHDVQSFKPDPAVYEYFIDSTGGTAESTWLVSANPFDVIGAAHAGWQTAWIQRDPAVAFDPWDITPTITIASLGELAASIA
jgi:2-haloacid dehalogenase